MTVARTAIVALVGGVLGCFAATRVLIGVAGPEAITDVNFPAAGLAGAGLLAAAGAAWSERIAGRSLLGLLVGASLLGASVGALVGMLGLEMVGLVVGGGLVVAGVVQVASRGI